MRAWLAPPTGDRNQPVLHVEGNATIGYGPPPAAAVELVPAATVVTAIRGGLGGLRHLPPFAVQAFTGLLDEAEKRVRGS